LSKYNEIMDNVKVTDEMRERILSNIEKETASAEQSKTNVTPIDTGRSKKSIKLVIRRAGQIAAVFAILIVSFGVAAVVTGRFRAPGGMNESASEEAAYETEAPSESESASASEEAAYEAETESASDLAEETENYEYDKQETLEGDAPSLDKVINEPASTEDAADSEETDAVVTSNDVCGDYLAGITRVDGLTFEERYEELISEIGQDPSAYCMDINGDGYEDLVVSCIYYGYDIYFNDGSDLHFITGGDGTADVVCLFDRNGQIYIGHEDTTHFGREYHEFCLYDMDGNITESIKLSVEYEDSEGESYDENSNFYLNDNKISMAEYEETLNQFTYFDITGLETAN